jgi:uncharacterized protein (DUF1800 family)
MKIAKNLMIALFVAGFSANAAAEIPIDQIFKASLEEPVEGPGTPQEAARFLQQATFGPKLSEIENLAKIGYNAWFDAQFAATRSEHTPYIDGLIAADIAAGREIRVFQGERVESWFRNALFSNNDQLRQRMAFALSQIFVISDQNGAIEGNPTTISHYYDLLSANAFGSYRTLLGDVTLHPAMGRYLSMHSNEKPNAAQNIRPDENYAREIMQLFSIGLVQLNLDGSPVLVGGNPVPSYTPQTISGFAFVFTGWNYATCRPPTAANAATSENYKWRYCDTVAYSVPPSTQDYRSHAGWREPMKPWGEGTAFPDLFHAANDSSIPVGGAGYPGKQLLNYSGVSLANGVLPNGGTARNNLNAALDNVANHPNVGPFISRLLIQRFVTSNPSPGYVSRVATVFNTAPRGNLKNVLKAILLDTEARRPTAANAGKVREPLLRLTELYRAFDANSRNPDGSFVTSGIGEINEYTNYWTAQSPVGAPTVFNFYLPNYRLPGEVTTLNLYSPEFQITTDTFITRIHNEFAGRVYWQYRGNNGLSPPNEYNPMLLDFGRDELVAGNGENLVNRYNLLMMGGKMSPAMRSILIAHVNDMPNSALPSGDRRYRAQDMLWLIMNSPEYVVEK